VELTGIEGVLDIRQIAVQNTAGTINAAVITRPWWWVQRYYVNTGAVLASGQPKEWAQYGRGANGTFILGPAPLTASWPTIIADCALLPVALTSDSTPEAIPEPWQDAVPYYAAYMALLSAQRRDDADRMFARYKDFMRRAVENSTPTRFPTNFPGGRAAQIAAAKVPLSVQPSQGKGG
jgi:hypothetical protein